MIEAQDPAGEDDELWHPSGWSPVYLGRPTAERLAGFTTLQSTVATYLLSRPAEGEEMEGAFILDGEARRILGREFYVWVVETGNCGDMPDFWPI